MNSPPTDPLIGRTISQYDVVAKLGGGGMGVVYKATDTKLGRTVALKFLPPQWTHDDNAKQRFLREAQAASATNHRNICVIHDIGETDDGQLFIVMAYYEGQTLKQKLDAGPLPAAEAMEIATEIAEGLAKAHALSVVHRDIKPGNLIVTDDGVKVLDFGLAKFADAVKLTLEGSTVGTAAYMSPEQVRGEEADARSDIWALGVVMYEMLTGEVPFKGGYAEAIFHAIKHEAVPPLVRSDRDVPEGLERIVLRTLEKDPAARYQSARELARELRQLQGRTVPLDLRTEALPDMAGARLRDPSLGQRVRRELTLWRAMAALAVIALAGFGSYRYIMRPVVRIPVAIAPVANHTGESQLDDYRLALTESLIAELGGSPNIRVVPFQRLLEIVGRFTTGGADVSSREAIQAIATAGGARVVVIPSLEYQGGAWFGQVEFRDVDKGAAVGTFRTEPVTSALPQETATRLVTALTTGVQNYFKTNGPGRSFTPRPASSRLRTLDAARAFEEGVTSYEQLEYAAALAAFQRAASQDSQHAMTQAWLSRVLLTLSRGNEAVAAGQRAKQLAAAGTLRSEGAFVDAVLAESRGDLPAAEAAYRQLVAVEPDDSSSRIELADFLMRQNRNQDAIAAYRDALALDSGYIRPHVDLCQLYTRVDDQPLAEKEGQSALDQYRAAGDRSGEAQALLCLGDMQRAQGGAHLADARRNIESAHALFVSLNQPYNLSRSFQYLGVVAGSAFDYPAAMRFFGEALTRSREVGNRQLEGLELMNLGVASEALGQRRDALKYYEDSRDVYQQIGNERRAAEQEINVASLLVNVGNQAEALRRATNGSAALAKLGSVEFEVTAMQVAATSQFHAGRHLEARRELREALARAKERRLGKMTVSLTEKLAESELLTGEYTAARAQLEETTSTEDGRASIASRITLGRIYTRLGDFDAARKQLESALAEAQARAERQSVSATYEALGELAYESDSLADAQAQFQKAASFWTDDFPEAASIESRCHLELVDALIGKAPGPSRGYSALGARLSGEMGRFDLEVPCRLDLAQVAFHQRRYADALAVLDGIPLAGERLVGAEVQARVHQWRGRVLAARGQHAESERELATARMLAEGLRDSLPPADRPRFVKRPDINQLLETRDTSGTTVSSRKDGV